MFLFCANQNEALASIVFKRLTLFIFNAKVMNRLRIRNIMLNINTH